MPLLETKGAGSAQGFGLTLGSSYTPTYIEEVFSTWLYTGNGSTQTITNGIDLSTKGGLVWCKYRNVAGQSHGLFDTARGASNVIYSNLTNAQASESGVTAFNTTGFSLGSNSGYNANNGLFVSWTFRKQPKFFDVVTYTGDGNSNRTVSHSLGSVPGCIIIKRTNVSTNWIVWHRGDGTTNYNALSLNATDGSTASVAAGDLPTSTTFKPSALLGSDYLNGNANGGTYVAYLFAHNAGGFGLTGTDNVITCGSVTTDGSGLAAVDLGYEPQWVLFKKSNVSGNWNIVDNMRGWTNNSGGNQPTLLANSSAAEASAGVGDTLSSTGFRLFGNASDAFIYIAIRRGPMKTPTTGTSVFDPVLLVNGSTNLPPVNSTINAPDLAWSFARNAVYGYGSLPRDRLSSAGISYLETSSTAAEASYAGNTFGFTRLQKGIDGANAGSTFNQASPGTIYWMFGRAPGFFDLVCYTGNASFSRTVNHNLGVTPELTIVKCRSASGENWVVTTPSLGESSAGLPKNLYLESTMAAAGGEFFNASGFTSTTIGLRGWSQVNGSGSTYVAYLFASCPGVSKCGSYTGTGALQTVNCGFTGGARFVLIKRTDSTGDWFVYDSTRGITSGNDPYLLINSATAEVTGTNYVDTTSVGFQVTAAAPAGLNANGGSYIYLAIA